ncbi:MAG: hypothetical protein WDW38_004720 [Sanguina aurantia]
MRCLQGGTLPAWALALAVVLETGSAQARHSPGGQPQPTRLLPGQNVLTMFLPGQNVLTMFLPVQNVLTRFLPVETVLTRLRPGQTVMPPGWHAKGANALPCISGQRSAGLTARGHLVPDGRAARSAPAVPQLQHGCPGRNTVPAHSGSMKTVVVTESGPAFSAQQQLLANLTAAVDYAPAEHAENSSEGGLQRADSVDKPNVCIVSAHLCS